MARSSRTLPWPRRQARGSLASLAILLLVAACAAPPGWTRTDFSRTAEEIASAFSAAGEMLEDAHTGRLTNAYLRGAFVNFGEAIAGMDADLPELEGRPDDRAVRQLLDAYSMGNAVVTSPCVDAGCDWEGQVDALRAAAAAFQDASR